MEEKDIFRDSPLRYMGYANELGESFRWNYTYIVLNSLPLGYFNEGFNFFIVV